MKLLVILILPVLIVSQGSILIDDKRLEYFGQCQSLIFEQKWQDAYDLVDEWSSRYSRDTGPRLNKLAIMQSEMQDLEENTYGDYFKALGDSIIDEIDNSLEYCSLSDSAMSYLYLGHLHAYRSIWEARFGSKWSSVRQGYKASGAYRKGLKADSTLYDLYFGLGSFHYWKSVKSGMLRSIGFIKNEKEKGISELKLAIDSALFSSRSAKAAMIWIYINEEKYDSALALTGEFLDNYPDSRTFLWPAGESARLGGQDDPAFDFYRQILSSLKNKPGNYYNIVEASYWMTQLRPDGDQVDYIKSILPNIPKETLKKQKKKIEYIVNINKSD